VYHRIEFIGRLGNDPESRFTPSGTQVTNFSVAVNMYRKNADGERDDETIWFRVAAWGKLAEICNQYLSKGRLVFVAGEIRPGENGSPRVYQRNDETFGASYEINARDVKFLSQKGEVEESSEEEPEDTPF